MKRPIPIAVLFAIALTIVSLLPFYVEQTMTHVMFADGSGGAIWSGWKRCSLREYWADYHYMDREERARWLTVDVALAVSYASVATFAASRLLSRRLALIGST